ncbi:hypothetical protein PFISCL1PPCAC_16039 [Pristionchus fissidentatus]|uniref:Inhibitor of growth protein n=1 Tax=Pristionchus fissidentatus TaxID=1538716 RepID=A0AAV5VYQ3_9BILA|nr:hypothetical protein PFISCL1PPCAC_16039 [Pristionchus fissidentatus]
MDIDKIFAEGMDQLEKLPAKVQKCTSEIRTLDIKCAELNSKVKIKTAAFMKALKKMNKEQKNKHYKEIDEMFDELEKMTRKKVNLATQLYDSVDEDISAMDKTTKRLEAGSRRGHNDEEASTSDGRKKKKRKGEKVEEETEGMNVPMVEMPIDPNEPLYCTCHAVSFGEMVCCDNPDCRVEWFHFQCVGMVTGPPSKVKWFCEACRPGFKHVPNQWNYETNEAPKKMKKVKDEEEEG